MRWDGRLGHGMGGRDGGSRAALSLTCGREIAAGNDFTRGLYVRKLPLAMTLRTNWPEVRGAATLLRKCVANTGS